MSWPDDLAAFSQMLDENTEAEGPMHHARIRLGKLNEEAGEVEDAVIAWEGSNPRKRSDDPGDWLVDKVIKELLDVATAALGAVEHLTGNQALSARLLSDHCRHLRTRLQAAIAPDRTDPQADDGATS